MHRVLEYHTRAIDVDMDWAASHRALALVYKARGDQEMALRHWQEYLRIEPAGQRSREAKAEIEALRR